MFSIIARKILNNKLLSLCLLLGSVISIALVCSIPMYTEGILQRLLLKDLERLQQETDVYPGHYFVGTGFTYNSAVGKGVTDYPSYHQRMESRLVPSLGLDVVTRVHRLSVGFLSSLPEGPRGEDALASLVNLDALTGFSDHVEVVSGRMFSGEVGEDGIVEAIVAERALYDQDLRLNEVYRITDTRGLMDGEMRIRVVGVFDMADPRDTYWYQGLWDYADSFVIDYDLFRSLFLSPPSPLFSGAEWYYALDYHQIRINDLERLMRTFRDHIELFDQYRVSYKIAALPVLEQYSERERFLRTTLAFLQIPILLLLVFYIYMVSTFVVENEANEIAVAKSRGSSSLQVFLIYLVEGLVFSAAAVVIGPLIGLFLCTVIGSSNGFMEFVQRTALDLRISGQTYAYSVAGVVLFVSTMLIPAYLFSRTTIVLHKRSRSRKTLKLTWKKLGVDLILLGIAGYGYYGYRTRQEVVLSTGVQGTQLPIDPLLFTISTAFILGLGLFFLRIFPLIVRIVFQVGRRLWSPALYASFIQVGRSRGRETFFMLFLMFTTAIGIFSSNSARSINQHIEDRIRYLNGADVALMEQWKSNEFADEPMDPLAVGGGSQAEANFGRRAVYYEEPPWYRFRDIPGVDAATKVFRKNGVTVRAGSSGRDALLLGIVPHEFARIAWVRSDLFPTHWFDYLNFLSDHPMGVLLSRNFEHAMELSIGDSIYFTWAGQRMVEAIVYRFVDYWPSYNPHEGNASVQEDFLIVANLKYIQAKLAKEPYEVWMSLEDDASTEAVYAHFEAGDYRLSWLSNAEQELIRAKNDPILQGTNGALTLGFLTTLLICLIGFLIYFILSFQSRLLQFGVFRAMGLSKRSVLRMIFSEQVLISGMAIAVGIVIGEITSYLFVPMLQVLYEPSRQVPPFRVVAHFGDYARLYLMLGGAMVIGFTMIGLMISRLRVAQVLKLGEE